MKQRLLPSALVVFLVASLTFLAWAFGPARGAVAYSDTPPMKKTGGPGEGTCSCHNGGLNDGVGTIAITNVPASYVPGQAYTVSVTLARAGQSRWGFELTCLTSGGNAAGTIANTTPFTLLQTGSTGRQYISHTTLNSPNDGTFAGTADGPVTWSFQWTAPAQGTGTVTFYVCGVAADNSLDADSGDFDYTTSVSATEGSPTPATASTWGKIKALYR